MNPIRNHINMAIDQLEAALDEAQYDNVSHITRVECALASSLMLLQQARKLEQETSWEIPSHTEGI